MKRLVMLVLTVAAAAAIAVPAVSSARGKDHRRSEKTTHRSRTDATHRSKCGKSEICGLDTEYMKESMAGDLFEIRGGQIALQKSSNAAVQRLANQLIKDHTKSYATSAALARKLGIKVQTDPSPTEQWQLQAIQQFSGSQFDTQYASLEVFDHMQDIDLATHERGDGCEYLVRDNARDELPTLRMHLALAQETLKAVKGS